MFTIILLFLIFEPDGFYGRWQKIKTYFHIWPYNYWPFLPYFLDRWVLTFLNFIWANNLLRANWCSSVFIESRNTIDSCCITWSRVDCIPWRRISFDFCKAVGGMEAICLAIFLASGISRLWGNIWLTAPISKASWASKGLAVKISSAALPYPMSLGRK